MFYSNCCCGTDSTLELTGRSGAINKLWWSVQVFPNMTQWISPSVSVRIHVLSTSMLVLDSGVMFCGKSCRLILPAVKQHVGRFLIFPVSLLEKEKKKDLHEAWSVSFHSRMPGLNFCGFCRSKWSSYGWFTRVGTSNCESDICFPQ